MRLGCVSQLGQAFLKAPLHLCDRLLSALIGFLQKGRMQFRHAGREPLFLLTGLMQGGLHQAFTLRLRFLYQAVGGALCGQQLF